MAAGLSDRLAWRHGIRIAQSPGEALHHYDPVGRILHLAAHLNPGQMAFQIARCFGVGFETICHRPACPQRAFPMAGRPLATSPGEARFARYSGTG